MNYLIIICLNFLSAFYVYKGTKNSDLAMATSIGLSSVYLLIIMMAN